MGLREEFINNVVREVENNSIYIWGGQGEKVEELTIKKIEKMEDSTENAKRVVKHIASIYPNTNLSRAFDCSGLLTYHLMKLGIIGNDTTANGLLKRCKQIAKKDLRPGDFVFKMLKDKAVHVAMFYKEGGTLVECVGRDDGVKFTELTTKFTKFGRLPQFDY